MRMVLRCTPTLCCTTSLCCSRSLSCTSVLCQVHQATTSSCLRSWCLGARRVWKPYWGWFCVVHFLYPSGVHMHRKKILKAVRTMSRTQFEVHRLGSFKKWKKQAMLVEMFELILFNVAKTKKAEVLVTSHSQLYFSPLEFSVSYFKTQWLDSAMFLFRLVPFRLR